MKQKLQQISADLEELQSRGFGHPDAATIVGRVKVTLQQACDETDDDQVPPDPVEDQLKLMHAELVSLHQSVAALVAAAPK